MEKQSIFFHRTYLLFILLLFGCICLIISIFLSRRFSPAQQITATVLPHSFATGEGSYVTMTNIPHQMKFVSPQLGISFLYLDRIDAGTKTESNYIPVKVAEEADTVYIYAAYPYQGFDYHKDAPFVQIFHKDPHDSLTTAIAKSILKGYSPYDCFIQEPARNTPENTSYETVSIDFPRSESVTQTMKSVAKCPAPYAAISGTFYFVMDKNHPDTFAFFDIGTSNFAPTSYGTWNETLQFFH